MSASAGTRDLLNFRFYYDGDFLAQFVKDVNINQSEKLKIFKYKFLFDNKFCEKRLLK